MAFVRRWARVSRVSRTLWPVRRHVGPQLSRVLSSDCRDDDHHTLPKTPCAEIHLKNRTDIDALLSSYQEELLDEQQAVEFLEEILENCGDDRRGLLSSTRFSDVINLLCENSVKYTTSSVIDLLEVLYKHGVHQEQVCIPLAEELASRIQGASFHEQQQVLHTLWKLKLNHLHLLHESLDTVSFAKALRENGVNENTVGNTVYSLRGQTWSTELKESLQGYVFQNASKLDLRSIYLILSVMIEKGIASVPVLKTFAQAVVDILTLAVPVEDRWEEWGSHYPYSLCNLLWAFGKVNFYDKDLFAAFASLTERSPDPLLLTPRFLSNLAWCCAKVRFYSESLMAVIANTSVRDLREFTNQDLALLLYSFGVLNCKHIELFDMAVEKVVSDPSHLENTKLCWIMAWVGMVLSRYPQQLLSEMLTDDFLKYSSVHTSFNFTALLQLSITMNFEQPNLGFGFNFDPSFARKWGRGFPRVGGVSDAMMWTAMSQRISNYKFTSLYSPFSQNVGRALKVALGSSYSYNTEVLTLGGYNLDFEVLFDAEHRPIPIPIQWKYRKKEILLNSVGIGRERKRKSLSADLVQTLKETERDSHSSPSTTSNLFTTDSIQKQKLINLASDWGQKFTSPNRPVAKKVAVEADGLWHFATNCNHILGSTVLKHRQLKALGWEVVSIPYMEWEELVTGDDHVLYLVNKLNLPTFNHF